MTVALWFLLQDGSTLLRDDLETQIEVVVCNGDVAEYYETCEVEDASDEELRRFLMDVDRTASRNAAAALAIREIADGVAQLTIDASEPWTRRLRIGAARLLVDREGGERILWELMEDPCLRARRAAAALLDEEPREPWLTSAHRDALVALSSDDPDERDEATAALLDALADELVAERDRTGDPEVRGRLDRVIAAIRARESPPVTLADAGIVRNEDGYLERKLMLTNHIGETVTYYGDDPTKPLYGLERFDEADGKWRDYTPWGCGTTSAQTLEPGASVAIGVGEPESGRYRIYDDYRTGSRVIRVYSPPLTVVH